MPSSVTRDSRRKQLGRLDVIDQRQVAELAQRRDPEPERRTEGELRLGVEPDRVEQLEARAPDDPRQVADEIEVPEEGDPPELRVAEAIAPRRPLGRAHGRARGGSHHGARARRGRRGRRPGVHPPQEVEPLPLHRLEIAGDAAVVADELRRGARLGVTDVVRVEQALERLAARRREAVLERLAVLLDQEVGLEADVDVVPGQPRRDRDRPEVAPHLDAAARDRLLPQLDAQGVVPAVEPAPGPERRLEHVGHPPVAAGEDPLDVRLPGSRAS